MPSTRARLVPTLALLLATSGCPSVGVSLRPDGSPGPEECPQEALKTMRILRMHVGDAADVELDANQMSARPITLYDGPVESVLESSLGMLDPATRLYGRVWTAGPQVVIRYYEAHPPDGDTVPICAVARLGRGQLRKKPESQPGTAILEFSEASAYVVNSFR
ncbi:hypothetical protein [Archangium gephyra]|nr:hypothetical protein [Archangium gephyra]